MLEQEAFSCSSFIDGSQACSQQILFSQPGFRRFTVGAASESTPFTAKGTFPREGIHHVTLYPVSSDAT